MTISMLRSSSQTDSSSDLSQQVMFKQQQPLALDCCCPDNDKIGDPKDHHDSDHDDDEVSSTVTVEDTLAQEQKRKEALQQLVSNDFGLTLLAPLSCDGLMEFHRCDLHLHDSSSCSATTSEARAIPPRQEEEGEGQHAAHEEKSTPKKARNHFIFGSLGSITAATQEPDSDEVTSHDDIETSTLEDSDSDVEDDDSDDDDDDYVLSISQLLVPEPADDLQYCPRILSPKQMQQIYQRLPEGLRMNKWVRAFCIGRDGDSFLTLLNNCAPYTYTLIVIRTLHEEYVLGGFASQAWRCDRHAQNQNSYYGTGQSFLFATHPHDYNNNNNNNHTDSTTTAKAATTTKATTKTPTSLSHASTPIMDNATRKRSSLSNILSNDDEDDDHEDDDDDDDVDLTFFGWTGSNDYCQICNSEKGVIAMGGEVDFGLRLENCFERGRTGYCKTFSNPPLVPDEGCHLGGHFEIADFEVYGLQPLFGGNLSSCSTTSSWSSLR